LILENTFGRRLSCGDDLWMNHKTIISFSQWAHNAGTWQCEVDNWSDEFSLSLSTCEHESCRKISLYVLHNQFVKLFKCLNDRQVVSLLCAGSWMKSIIDDDRSWAVIESSSNLFQAIDCWSGRWSSIYIHTVWEFDNESLYDYNVKVGVKEFPFVDNVLINLGRGHLKLFPKGWNWQAYYMISRVYNRMNQALGMMTLH
jgi:hypothetical protein